jgi:DNA-binding winged helix-turn-helix (wHTH) protein
VSYAFGPFRLDAQGEALFRGTEPVALSQRAVALLRILVERAGAPVTKDALIEAAWPGLVIEDSNLTVQIAALRRALGEVPGGEGWIVTLHRRGYRFAGPAVTKSEPQVPTTPTADPTSKLSPTMAPFLPENPSIAVHAV